MSQPAPQGHRVRHHFRGLSLPGPSALLSALPPALLPALASALLLNLLAASAATAAEARVDTITWLSLEPSPSAYNADSHSEQMLSDPIKPYVQAHWPTVQHRVLKANPRRAWQMLGLGEQVCQSHSVRTAEREKRAYFTNTIFGPPMQLIVRREQADQVPRNAAGEVDLPRLLAEGRLRGAVIDGRSYGSHVDAQLAGQPTGPTSSLTRYASADFGSKLLPMLGQGRVDYTIEYDMAVSRSRSVDPRIGDLVSLPIAGASEPVVAGVACPRTPWGLAAIRHIDKVLGTPEGAAMLRESAQYWLTNETRKLYQARMDAFYKERARPSVIR